MDIITGQPVTGDDFLRARLYLIDELRDLAGKGRSILIDAPRRFGKTSVVKEFMRQEKGGAGFEVLFMDLEHLGSSREFCGRFFLRLLEFNRARKTLFHLGKTLGGWWNALAAMVPKLKAPEFEIEFGKLIGEDDFSTWQGRIEPLLKAMNDGPKKFVVVFDEFPDMILNFQKELGEAESKLEIDAALAWLRSLRQGGDYEHCVFVYCGSVNLKATLAESGLGHRINDLEPLHVPPLTEEEAGTLLEALLISAGASLSADALNYARSLIADGPPYYGQILAKALRERRKKHFEKDETESVVEAALRGRDHDIEHYHSRLDERLDAKGRAIAEGMLSALCVADSIPEKRLFDERFHGLCEFEEFARLTDRLVHEGYIHRNPAKRGELQFTAPLLKRWWACRKGLG